MRSSQTIVSVSYAWLSGTLYCTVSDDPRLLVRPRGQVTGQKTIPYGGTSVSDASDNAPLGQGQQLQSKSCFFPRLHVVLNVPFWLPYAPPPLLADKRRRLLGPALKYLKEHNSNDQIQWTVADLQFARTMEKVCSKDTIWHPDELVLRKGCLLRGDYQPTRTEETSSWLRPVTNRNFVVRILSRSIEYYDYGIGALEYLFEFTSSTEPLDLLMNDAAFLEGVQGSSH